MSLAVVEYFLRASFGLGNPIVYYAHPYYGFRPRPNQHIKRFNGSSIKINNLSLRGTTDWDNHQARKVLFLGDSVTYGGSYIDDNELFSSILGNKLNLISGNAGVNAWGIGNIHGLIVRANFLPSRFYVTVIPEEDFYRGTTNLSGLPFWARPPNFALEELFHHGMYKLLIRQYIPWVTEQPISVQQSVVKKSVDWLNEIESLLSSKEYKHVVFISPCHIGEKLTEPDAIIKAEMANYRGKHFYIQDLLSEVNTDVIFYDRCHLSKGGHQAWADAMYPILKQEGF